MKRKVFSAVFACVFVFCVSAQRPFSEFSVGVDGGTLGVGVWGATNLTSNISLRAGFSYASWSFDRMHSEPGVEGFINGDVNRQVDVDIDVTNPRLRIPHGRLLVDWAPGGGMFSVVAGTYIGTFNLGVDAQVMNYDALRIANPDMEFIKFDEFGIELRPIDGVFDGTLRIGNRIKPYLGIGFGRTIPENRLGFRFDIGVIHQGDLRFISDQAGIDDLEGATTSIEIPDDWGFVSDFSTLARFWPVVNFSLTFRLN